MGLYQDWVVPTLIDLSMRNKSFALIASAWRALPRGASST